MKETLDLCGSFNNEDVNTPFVGVIECQVKSTCSGALYNSWLFPPNQLVAKLLVETRNHLAKFAHHIFLHVC